MTIVSVELYMVAGSLLPQKLPNDKAFSSLPFNIVTWSLTQLVDCSISISINLSSMLWYAGKSMIQVQLELEVYGELGNPYVLI